MKKYFFVMGLVCLISGCQKPDVQLLPHQSGSTAETRSDPGIESFFKYDQRNAFVSNVITSLIYTQNTDPFVNYFVDNYGIPYWDEAIVTVDEDGFYGTAIPVTDGRVLCGLLLASQSTDSTIQTGYASEDIILQDIPDLEILFYYLADKLGLENANPALMFIDDASTKASTTVTRDCRTYRTAITATDGTSWNEGTITKCTTITLNDYRKFNPIGGGGSGGSGGGGNTGGDSGPGLGDGDDGLQPPYDPTLKPYPCSDGIRGVSDPLKKMEILGSKNNGIKGGQYGTGRGRMHYGLDLDAPVGTPVYAMYNGTVGYAINKYDPSLPYPLYKDKYGSDGAVNYDAGNRVKIYSVVNGDKIEQKYMHMDRVCVQEGSQILAGDLIGYSGMTGSAGAGASAGPHLHLEIRKNGTPVNPEPYLYADFNDAGMNMNDCFELGH